MRDINIAIFIVLCIGIIVCETAELILRVKGKIKKRNKETYYFDEFYEFGKYNKRKPTALELLPECER